MTDNPPLAWEPEACTLPTEDRPLRLAEFDELFSGLQARELLTPTHLRMRLAGPAGLEAAVRDLTAREVRCCSFFSFTTTVPDRAADLVILDVEVPANQTAVLRALADRAQSIAASRGV